MNPTERDPAISTFTRRALGRTSALLGLTAAAASSAASSRAAPADGRKTVGVVLYPNFEVLDVFGPVEMWANAPGLHVILISQHGGAVRSAQGVSVMSDASFETAPPLAVMMVPGGTGTLTELANPVFIDFLKARDRQTELTTSVCTGSALLAKAGLLDGRRATTNKKFFQIAASQPAPVTWVKHARWVEDGKYMTSSGVSAGTDMALGLLARLYGAEHARMLARTLEYQWSEDPANDPFAIG